VLGIEANLEFLDIRHLKPNTCYEETSVLKTILVALDSSADAPQTRTELSEQVMQALQTLQLQSTTQIILSHVIPPAESSVDLAVDRPHPPAEEFPYRQIEQQLQAYQANLPCPSDLEIVTGDPAEEIIRLANIYQADLIVIGSRGLTGLTRILQGSVSSQVVAEAACSVLVVKPK
jgi:nucleotide-binding universal stress UspA family protein